MNERRFSIVAQLSNLLYRRLPVGWRRKGRVNLCGLGIRDTAGWKSALRYRRIALLRRSRRALNCFNISPWELQPWTLL